MRAAARTDVLFPLLLACIVGHVVPLWLWPRDYFADDALFYLQIAHNVAHGNGFTFSGLMPTNGFHPLWLLICIPIAWLAEEPPRLLAAATLAIVLLNALTLLAMRGLLRRIGVPQPSAAVLFAAPYLFFVQPGMEAHLSALLLVLTLRAGHTLMCEPGAANRFRTAVLGGLLVFSRLDLAIVVAPLALWIFARDLARAADRAACARQLVLASLVASTPVALFLAINAIAFGTPVPVSGLLKMSVADAGGFEIDGIALLYLYVTLCGAVAGLLPPRDEYGPLHASLALGLLAFLAYVAFITSESFSWYYATWAAAAMSGAGLLLRGGARLAETRGGRLARAAVPALGAGLALFGLFSMVRYGDSMAPDRPPPFARDEASLTARAAHASIERVFTFDRPGELAFYHGLSVLAADGLTTNPPFQRELAERGIQWALESFRIQAVVMPLLGGNYSSDDYCGRLYLASVRVICDGAEPPRITGLEVFSRLDGSPLGRLDLDGLPRLDDPEEDLVVFLLFD